MRTITLMIPDLLPILNKDDNHHQCSTVFKRLLAGKQHKSAPYGSALECLYHYLGGKANVPLAALTAHRYRLPPAKAWLLADPVECQADMHTVYCLGNAHLDICMEETMQLLDSLNEHLTQDGCRMYAPESNQWLLALDAPVDYDTTPLAKVLNQNIAEFTPRKAKSSWQRLFVEIEMLLHQHPVNQARAAANKPLINACWFWGEGVLNAFDKRPEMLLFSDNPLCRVLGEWVDAQVHELKADLPAVLAVQNESTKHCVVSLSQSDMESQSTDAYLSYIEKNWLNPLFDLFNKREIGKAVVYVGENLCYDLVRTGFKIKVPFLT